MDYPKFKVCVKCLTFNHSKYIIDAMNGFTMQQTDFPFVCCIVDDASTDGEQDIIRKYLEDNFDFSAGSTGYWKEADYGHIAYAQHKTNKNCHFAVILLKENLYSKKQGYKKAGYIAEWRDSCEYDALCEGDDYWIVPDKLQKQVEVLDSNPEYSMCVTDAVIQSEKGELNWTRYDQDRIVPINDIIVYGGSWLQTATFVYRNRIRSGMIECGVQSHTGDYPLMIWCAMKGNVYFLAEKTAVYRYGYGWTKSFKKVNIEKKIIAYRSEINMLKGFDEYSNFKYHKSFIRRRKIYMTQILKGDKSHMGLLKNAFREEYCLFSLLEKSDFVFYKLGLSIVPRIRRKLVR